MQLQRLPDLLQIHCMIILSMWLAQLSCTVCALQAPSKHLNFVATEVFVMAHEAAWNQFIVTIFLGNGSYAANPPMASYRQVTSLLGVRMVDLVLAVVSAQMTLLLTKSVSCHDTGLIFSPHAAGTNAWLSLVRRTFGACLNLSLSSLLCSVSHYLWTFPENLKLLSSILHKLQASKVAVN